MLEKTSLMFLIQLLHKTARTCDGSDPQLDSEDPECDLLRELEF